MDISVGLKKLLIRRSSDSTLVARVAQSLAGEYLLAARPRTYISGEDALALQKSSVETAAWAAEFCEDPDVTRKIFSKTKRVGVRIGAVKNARNRGEDIEFFWTACGELGNAKLRRALEKTHGTPGADLLGDVLRAFDQGERHTNKALYQLRRSRLFDDAAADVVCGRAIECLNMPLLGRIVVDYYASGSSQLSLTRGSYGPEDVLAALDAEQTSQVLSGAVAQLARSVLVRQIDADMARLWIDHVDPANLVDIVPGGDPQCRQMFAKEAYELLWNAPGWSSLPMIIGQYCDDDQFERALFLDVEYPGVKFWLAGSVDQGDERFVLRLELVKEYLLEQGFVTAAYDLARLYPVVEQDAARARLLGAGNVLDITDYLCGRFRFSSDRYDSLPVLVEDVAPLADVINSSENPTGWWALYGASARWNLSAEVRAEIARRAPFVAWNAFLADEAIADMLFDGIEASGIDAVEACVMITSNPYATMRDYFETFAAVARSNAG